MCVLLDLHFHPKPHGKSFSNFTLYSVKTGPSVADAAMGRITQGTKVIAEGGYEKIFRQAFETLPEEQLKKAYACYLSTSAGPVMGTLYLSTAKLAFCSDSPLSYKVGDQTEWSYYKVCISYLFLPGKLHAKRHLTFSLLFCDYHLVAVMPRLTIASNLLGKLSCLTGGGNGMYGQGD